MLESRARRAGLSLRHIKTFSSTRQMPDLPVNPPGHIPLDPDEMEGRISHRSGTGFTTCLIGPRGTGKTQIAVNLVLRELHAMRGKDSEDRDQPRYVLASDLFREIRDSFKVGGEMACMKKFTQPRLLVIDEIQERGNTTFEDSALTNIIDHRYGDMLDTLLISNLKREELIGALGNPIASRMTESGGVLECTWPSFRGAK